MKAILIASAFIAASTTPAVRAAQVRPLVPLPSAKNSTYVPVDSWVYPALLRLQALGYLDTAFLGIRPWTRLDIARMLARPIPQRKADHPGEEVSRLLAVLRQEFTPVRTEETSFRNPRFHLESQYTRLLGIGGLPLRDSFHLGQTVINDYGRPYQRGFNPLVGASAVAGAGRVSLYVRGEYQHAPSSAGYSAALSGELSAIDQIPYNPAVPQATIPQGPIAATNVFRLTEAILSYRLLNHEISLGKSDHWLGPGQGGSLSWSNNAENIYAFQIDRSDALLIPGFSRLFGPVRYLFFVGSLKGHTVPNDPWVHLEKISLKPTRNLELGFDRATIWGGKGHAPITVGTFFHSFFSVQNVTLAEKLSRNDPGARFGNFDFSYRLPFLRNWVTLYCDSLVHDDVSPVDAPRHAAFRPGLSISHFPGAPALDVRVEGADTDPATSRSVSGSYIYTEYIQKQGYTNKGFLLGDAIGRENKGGNAWITYHLSPQEQVQFGYRNVKSAKDFIPGGTTENQWEGSFVKRFHHTVELRGLARYERWSAPVYKTGVRSDLEVSGQFMSYVH